MPFDDRIFAADAALCGEVWRGDGGFGFLERLVDTCHGRFAGTDDERRAAGIVIETFERIGLTSVHREPFTYDGWTRGAPARLRRLDNDTAITTFSLPGSPPGHVEADVLDLGCATEEEVGAAGETLKGKIAIVSAATPPGGKPSHRNEKVARAARNGAAAVLWMRDQPGQLAETGSLFFQDAPRIPGLAVTREDGLRLARHAQHGAVRLEIHAFDVPRRLESWNLLGELEGSDLRDEVIMIGAHYDGHDLAEAANDNGSGVAAIIEAARALTTQRRNLRRTVRFIAFGVEELGLYGAHAYCDAHDAGDLDHVRLLFNLDTIASPGATKGVATQRRPDLRPMLEEIGRAMGDPFPVIDHISMYSDQFPFTLAGVPAAVLTNPDAHRTGGRGEGHTTSDTLDKVNPLSLKLGALFTTRLALYLANTDPWPAPRWDPKRTQEEMEKAGVRAVMEMEGTWPFPTMDTTP
jgi:Zn-dependent M28 family amino/carboxypeptidase